MHTWYVKGDLYLYHSLKRFKDIGAGTWPPVFDNWNLKKRSWPIWGHCVVVCEEKSKIFSWIIVLWVQVWAACLHCAGCGLSHVLSGTLALIGLNHSDRRLSRCSCASKNTSWNHRFETRISAGSWLECSTMSRTVLFASFCFCACVILRACVRTHACACYGLFFVHASLSRPFLSEHIYTYN